MLVIVADIVLGVSRSWAFHEFSSSKFRKGLVGHIAMFTFVAIFYPFAVFMNLGSVIDTFIFAMIAAYGLSLIHIWVIYNLKRGENREFALTLYQGINYFKAKGNGTIAMHFNNEVMA